MQKNPVRTAETRKKLILAFQTAFRKKPLNKITIGEITKAAGYNRGTFYEYFTDIYDLLNQMEDELIAQIKSDMLYAFRDGTPDNMNEYSLKCASVFKKYDDDIFCLLGQTGDPQFRQKLQHTFFEAFTSLFHISTDIPHLSYLLAYQYSALTGILTHWYENGKDLSEEEFVRILQTLVTTGITGYLNCSIFKNDKTKGN